MIQVHFGSKHEPATQLQLSPDLIAVRTRSRRSIARGAAPVASPAAEEVDDGQLVLALPEVGVEVYRVPVGKGRRSLDARKAALRAAPDVRFAGGVLVDPATKAPVLYTENLFVKFVDSADVDDCREVLRAAGLEIKSELAYSTNAFFVAAAEGTGRKVFEIAEELFSRADVEYCHPELIRERTRRAIFPEQWHLKRTTIGGTLVDAHANVDAAHAFTRGDGITVAIIDDGIDVDHAEFSGAGKVVAPRDASLQNLDPRPKSMGENHGTACAGVAVANGALGASGVAPAARLMPIRLSMSMGLGSQREAEAFVWAADHGADVISCSWGPSDGDWWDANDPQHGHFEPLPAQIRVALDYATAHGRGGKGCVILFAAGNGNEPIENDGYASYSKVIAVAACNDTGKRSVYSDFGAAVWCSFPSSDFGHAPFQQPEPITPGIWTTDRVGTRGYNSGFSGDGDPAGLFTATFGGTSSACPGAAGIAALVLSANPALKWNEVKDVLRRACDRIDPQGGAYSSSGHSAKYGYGRLNALRAVELARPQPTSEIVVGRRFDGAIPDLATVVFSLGVAETTPIEALSVSIDLKHTYVGDLVITLEPPSSTGVAPIVLHDRAGGNRRDLKATYDASGKPALASFAGKNVSGTWKLRIRDAAALDSGTLVSFGLTLRLAHPDRAVEAAPRRSRASTALSTRSGATKLRRARNGKKLHVVGRKG